MDDKSLDKGIREVLARNLSSPSEVDAAMRYHHEISRAVKVEENWLVAQIWIGLAGMIWGFYLPEWGWVVAGSSILMVFMGNVCPDWTPVGLWVRRRRRAREALQLKAIALAQLTEKQGER